MRWSPAGDMIATSSWDKTVALLDFKTGKPLYTGETSDGSNLSLLTKSQSSLFPYQIWLCLSASFEKEPMTIIYFRRKGHKRPLEVIDHNRQYARIASDSDHILLILCMYELHDSFILSENKPENRKLISLNFLGLTSLQKCNSNFSIKKTLILNSLFELFNEFNQEIAVKRNRIEANFVLLLFSINFTLFRFKMINMCVTLVNIELYPYRSP